MNAIYIRVSSDEQVKKGYSLDEQEFAGRKKYAEMSIVSDIKVYMDDGYSGKFLDRPDLDRLRVDVRSNLVKRIMFYDTTRMARHLAHQLLLDDEFKKYGVEIFFVTEEYDPTPEGRMFFQFRGSISEYEREKFRERAMFGKRGKARKGKIVHNARPFGYDWDTINSTYIINDAEADVLKLACDLLLTKNIGTPTIAQELKMRGIVGKKGKPMTAAQVWQMLNDPLYTGVAYSHKQSTIKTGQKTRTVTNRPQEDWIPITIPAIISNETRELILQKLQQNRRLSKRQTKRDYLLRGLIYCHLCGRGMVAYCRPATRKNGTTKNYYYYSCVTKESENYKIRGEVCECRRIPVDNLDNDVWQIIVDIATNKISLDQILLQSDTSDHAAEIEHLRNSEAALHKKRTDIMKWFRDNLIPADEAEKELQSIGKELCMYSTKIAELSTKQIKPPEFSPREILSAETFEDKRNILINSGIKVRAVRIGEGWEVHFTY